MLKKILPIVVVLGTLIVSPQSFAFKQSMYGGIELGQAKLNVNAGSEGLETFNGNVLGPASVSTKSNNVGGRLVLGYQFHRYVAAEAGLTKYGNTTVKNVFGVPNANVKITAQSLDAVAKAILPINQFNLFAKLGFAALNTKEKPNSTAKSIVTPMGSPDVSQSDTKAKPIYGLGAGADLNENFTVTFTWTRIAASSNNVDNATFSSIGFLYRFNI